MISDKCEVASGEVIPELCDGLFDGKSISLHGSIALFSGGQFPTVVQYGVFLSIKGLEEGTQGHL